MGVPPLLAHDALRGWRIGLSVSDSADLSRLGLLEAHLRLAIGEIARCVVVSGGDLVYGGVLREDGYTAFLLREVQRYGRRNQALEVCLNWSAHRAMSLSDLAAHDKNMGLYGKLTCHDIDGNPMDSTFGRGDMPVPESSAAVTASALTAFRRTMVARSNARVIIGGKRANFSGQMPGVLEEALIAIENRQPIYLAGGFGGATLDAVGALGIDDIAWFPARTDATFDPLLNQALTQLAAASAKAPPVSNGLTADENIRLARTHRPSEIATLIGLGLGRLMGST